jgi:hypothetical protein
LVSNVASSIRPTTASGTGLAGLPSDAKRSSWKFLFVQPFGTVQVRDIIVDDLGNRYQVTTPYWVLGGYQLTADLLEV